MGSVQQILVDIDTQRDFMQPGGALYMSGAERIVPNLVRLFEYACAASIPVLSSADCHAVGDPEFEAFPPHCVAGTPGQEKLEETLLETRRVVGPDERLDRPEDLFRTYPQVVFSKTTLDLWANPNAARVIEVLDVEEYRVFGVATDYCVRIAALGLLDRGQQVSVVGDAIWAVAEGPGRAAIEEMQAAGARWVTTDQIVGECA